MIDRIDLLKLASISKRQETLLEKFADANLEKFLNEELQKLYGNLVTAQVAQGMAGDPKGYTVNVRANQSLNEASKNSIRSKIAGLLTGRNLACQVNFTN